MKIGLALDDSLDRPDGVQQYILTLGDWLQNQGHEVHYLVGNTTNISQKNVHSLAKTISVKFNKNRLKIPLPTRRAKLINKLNELQLDVLHVQMPFSPLFVGKLVNNFIGPTVATFHILPSGNLSKIGNRVLARVQKFTINKIQYVIAVSDPAKEYSYSTYKTPIPRVIPNSVDLAKSDLNPEVKISKSEKVELRFLGRLVPRKGVMQLLAAFNILVKNTPNLKVHLTIGGAGPLSGKVRKFIIKNKLEKKVSMTGFVEEVNKKSFLAAADIAVFPATGGESFGIVLIEAIQAGAGVVVGGENPGYRYVLNDEKVLIDTSSPYKLAELLKKLVLNNDMRNSIHSSQQHLINKFDISVNGPKILDIYTTVIANISR